MDIIAWAFFIAREEISSTAVNMLILVVFLLVCALALKPAKICSQIRVFMICTMSHTKNRKMLPLRRMSSSATALSSTQKKHQSCITRAKLGRYFSSSFVALIQFLNFLVVIQAENEIELARASYAEAVAVNMNEPQAHFNMANFLLNVRLAPVRCFRFCRKEFLSFFLSYSYCVLVPQAYSQPNILLTAYSSLPHDTRHTISRNHCNIGNSLLIVCKMRG